MSKRTVIVSGGILEKEFVLPILQSEETEFIIGVDKGLQFLYENGIIASEPAASAIFRHWIFAQR